MFKQLCKQHYVFRRSIFTRKTYNHVVPYNRASADGNLQTMIHLCLFKILFYNIKPVASIQVSILSICYGNQDNDFDKLGQVEILLMVFLCFNFHIQVNETVDIAQKLQSTNFFNLILSNIEFYSNSFNFSRFNIIVRA